MTILPAVGLAAGYSYTITTSLPGVENIVAGNSASGITIAGYVAAIYKGALALVGFVAFVAIVYWGFVYTLSAGNTSRTSDATKGITQAIQGLVLLLAGYLILNFVNPALVNIQQTDTSLSNIKSIDKPDKSGETPGGYTGDPNKPKPPEPGKPSELLYNVTSPSACANLGGKPFSPCKDFCLATPGLCSKNTVCCGTKP